MNNLMVQMRHTANELKATLDHVRKGNDAAVTSQSSDGETISYFTEPDKAVESPHHDSEVRHKCFWSDQRHWSKITIQITHDFREPNWSHISTPILYANEPRSHPITNLGEAQGKGHRLWLNLGVYPPIFEAVSLHSTSSSSLNT